MSKDLSCPRRVRVERNIYRRPSGVYEVGFKDGGGKQRWRTVEGGITAARALRDEILSRRNRGERVAADRSLRFVDGAAKWLDGPVRISVHVRRSATAVHSTAIFFRPSGAGGSTRSRLMP